MLCPRQRDVDTLVVWDEPSWTRPNSWDENYLVLSSLRLVNWEHLDVLVLLHYSLQLSSLCGIRRDNGDVFRIELQGMQMLVRVDVLKPESEKFINRIAFRLVAEGGPDKFLRVVVAYIDEDKRMLEI